MKTKIIILPIIILYCTALSAWPQEISGIGAVTYIANEGFFIETANHKVLIDAIFGNIHGNWCDQPNDSVSCQINKGASPYDNIDVILVTHKHSDHFNDSMIISFLVNNQKTVLICPDQVKELLKKNAAYSKVQNNILSFKTDKLFDTTITINKINIEVLRFNHGSYFETDSATGNTYDLHSAVENYGYLLEADGFTFLHSGDCSTGNKAQFIEYNLPAKEIDVAFFDRVFIRPEGIKIMSDFKDIRNIVLMHIEPGKSDYYKSFVKDFPEFFVFSTKNEKKVFSK